jgi:hypothetical protein
MARSFSSITPTSNGLSLPPELIDEFGGKFTQLSGFLLGKLRKFPSEVDRYAFTTEAAKRETGP